MDTPVFTFVISDAVTDADTACAAETSIAGYPHIETAIKPNARTLRIFFDLIIFHISFIFYSEIIITLCRTIFNTFLKKYTKK